MTDTILLAAGGTGGHVFPGLATAAALRAAEPDLEIMFVGTADRLEARLVPEAGYPLHTVPAMALRRDRTLLRLPVVIGRAVAQVRALIKGRNVIAALGFGGYTSVPLTLAARSCRVPLVVHEQNAIPGRANRLAARGAHTVAVSYPSTLSGFGRTPTVLTGNPVRPGLLPTLAAGESLRDGRARLRDEAITALGLDPARRTLLAFGGSLGAMRINEAVVQSASLWADPERIQILHATGDTTHESTKVAWAAVSGGPKVELTRFLDRMDLAYAAADAVVCRAGASTIAELTALGIPSILVPYPHHADNQQGVNAQAVAQAGGAEVILDAELDGKRLVNAAEPLLIDDESNRAMSAAAAAFGRPTAADDLARLVLEVANR